MGKELLWQHFQECHKSRDHLLINKSLDECSFRDCPGIFQRYMYTAALYGEWWMLTDDAQVQTTNMGTLSQLNAETHTRATTLLVGEHESCTTHARSDTHSTCTGTSTNLPNRKQT